MYNVTIPAGVVAGQEFQVNAGGQMLSVVCPAGMAGGMALQVQGPAAPAPVAVATGNPAVAAAPGAGGQITFAPSQTPAQVVVQNLPTIPPAGDVLSLPEPVRQLMDQSGPTFLVRQDMDFLEFVTGFQRQNRYRIASKPEDFPEGEWADKLFKNAPQVLNAREESECIERVFCGSKREFTMHMHAGPDSSFPELYKYERPFRCTLNCCCVQLNDPEIETMTLENNKIGTVVQDYRFIDWCCGKTFWHVKDSNDEIKYVVENDVCNCDNCCAPSLCCPVRTFRILDPTETTQVGTLQNVHSGCTGRGLVQGTDNYKLDFPENCTAEHKALLLSATFLLEYVYFEKQPGNDNNSTGSPGFMGGFDMS